MSDINHDMVHDLEEFQEKQELKEKNIKDIDATVLAYCKNYTSSVNNVSEFVLGLEDQLVNDLWNKRKERSKKAKEAHKKKKADASQQQKQQNKNKQQSNNNQQKFQQ